jgi:hypothetical protein
MSSATYLTLKQYATKFYEEKPDFGFQKKDRVKKIKEIATKIFCSCWRTMGSYFSKVPLTLEIKAKYEELKGNFNAPQMVQNGAEARGALIRRRVLGSNAIQYVHEYYLKKIGKGGTLFTNFMVGGKADFILPPKDEIDGLLLVPVVLKGHPGDHIVGVVYDKENNRIEVYDPKGLNCEENSNLVFKSTQLKLKDVVAIIARYYGATSIWENTTRHQYDAHNCGIYTLDYFEGRLEGQEPDYIARHGRSYSEVNTTRRQHYIAKTLVEDPSEFFKQQYIKPYSEQIDRDNVEEKPTALDNFEEDLGI